VALDVVWLDDPPQATTGTARNAAKMVKRAWGNRIGARREYLSGGRFLLDGRAGAV
jgi:hypothetical protein